MKTKYFNRASKITSLYQKVGATATKTCGGACFLEHHAIKKTLNYDIGVNLTFLGPFGLFSDNSDYSADLALDGEWAFGLTVKNKGNT